MRMNIIIFYLKKNLFVPKPNNLNHGNGECSLGFLICLMLFGIHIYSTKLCHRGEDDGNWQAETHKGMTKSCHTENS